MARLTRAQTTAYAAAAGFTGRALDVIVAIAGAESDYQTDARYVNSDNPPWPDGHVGPSTDRGILQLNTYWESQYDDACCDDPACAFRAAYTISKGGANFWDWITFRTGRYQQYLSSGGEVVILPSYPFVNQLDGTDNQRMNCVPASLASAILYLNPGSGATADKLKDTEYGGAYSGGTALLRYVDQATDLARATYGVTAQSYGNGAMSLLIEKIHAWLRGGFPVLATIPSQWGNVYSLAERASGAIPTHVVAFYSEEGGLTAMNPWGAIKHTGSDAYWAARLCFNQVWRIYRESGGTTPMPLDISAVSSYFSVTTDGQWLCKQTNQHVRGGMLEFYRTVGPANNVPIVGLPLTEEIALPGIPDTFQVFERGVLVYDPAHIYDTQPGYTNVYLGKRGDPRWNPDLASLTSELTAAEEAWHSATASLQEALDTIATLKGENVKALNLVNAIKALFP